MLGPAKRQWLVVSVLALYAGLAIATMLTRSPWGDEAWFSSSAWNLATKGHMGTSFFEEEGTSFPGLNHHTYTAPPLYMVTQAAWFKLIGISILSSRITAWLWGLVLLYAWAVIIRKLMDSVSAAVLVCSMIALDYNFVMAASTARMDMMAEALFAGALASYLYWRERDFRLAILLSQSCVVACGLTHPASGILTFADLLFTTIYLDRRKIRPAHFIIAALPYAAGAAGWGLYILQEPSLFLIQFQNSVLAFDRLSFSSPLEMVRREIFERYLRYFGFRSAPTPYIRMLFGLLLIYCAGFTAALFTPSFRRNSGVRLLLLLGGLNTVLLLMLGSRREYTYLLFVLPLWMAVVALWIFWSAKKGWLSIPAAAVIVIAICGFHLGLVIGRAAFNTYHQTYTPVIRYLEERAGPNDIIMGSIRLAYGLGFDDRRLIYDSTLGFYSGKRPTFIVVDPEIDREIAEIRAKRPEPAMHVNRLLTAEFEKVYDAYGYQIFVRSSPSAQSGSMQAGYLPEHLQH